MASNGSPFDIGVATLHDLDDPRFFIDFFEHRARVAVELHGTAAEFYKSPILEAYQKSKIDLLRVAREIEAAGEDAAEPDSYKRCGFICF